MMDANDNVCILKLAYILQCGEALDEHQMKCTQWKHAVPTSDVPKKHTTSMIGVSYCR